MKKTMPDIGDIENKNLIIVAPNGARKTKKDHPNLPISPEELAVEVENCVAQGAAMVHLHARTAQGAHSLEVEDNLAVYHAVKQRLGDKVIIQLTTEAVGIYNPDQQMDLIRAIEPEAASFALVELIPSPEHEEAAKAFFHWLTLRNITSQYIVYSPEQLSYYLDLIERGVLPAEQHHLLFVLGRYNEKLESEPSDLDPFLELVKQLGGVRWAVCAFGPKEQECLLKAAQMGGDVRIGFENNLYTTEQTLADSNASQVKSLVTALNREGGTVMDVETARKNLFSA